MSNRRTRFDAPSVGDEVVASDVEVIGGPVGRYARIGARGWPFVAAVLSSLGSVFVALGVLQKNHCVSKGWAIPGSLWRECYSDLPVAVNTNPSQPWASGGPGATQPPLTAIMTWLLRQLVPDGNGLAQQRTYFAISAVFIALCVAGCVIAIAWAMPQTPWLAAHMALCPVLITSALVSLDAFGVLLATVGLAAWMRGHPTSAGILLGAAVMARSYPLVIVAAILLVAIRDRRTGDIARLLTGVLATTAIFVGVGAVLGDVLMPYTNWWDSAPSYGSIWMVFQAMHVTVSATTASWVAVIGWAMALLTGVYLTARPARLTPLPPLALTMLVIVLLTGKTFTPQSALWVIPFLALCALHWREHLIWAGVEILYFAMLWMYIGISSNPGKALALEGYTVFVVVRLVAYAALAFVSWESAEELQDDQESQQVTEREAAVVA